MTTTTAPRIGQHWPGHGGIYAGVMRGSNGQADYHLIVLDPRNHPPLQVKQTWGGYGTAEPGATCDGDGLANTKALVSSATDHPAAKLVAGLEVEGLADFYLAARHEARLAAINVPELFDRDEWYWTSTQYSAHLAWIQDFASGSQDDDGKDSEFLVCAVRRSPIE